METDGEGDGGEDEDNGAEKKEEVVEEEEVEEDCGSGGDKEKEGADGSGNNDDDVFFVLQSFLLTGGPALGSQPTPNTPVLELSPTLGESKLGYTQAPRLLVPWEGLPMLRGMHWCLRW